MASWCVSAQGCIFLFLSHTDTHTHSHNHCSSLLSKWKKQFYFTHQSKLNMALQQKSNHLEIWASATARAAVWWETILHIHCEKILNRSGLFEFVFWNRTSSLSVSLTFPLLLNPSHVMASAPSVRVSLWSCRQSRQPHGLWNGQTSDGSLRRMTKDASVICSRYCETNKSVRYTPHSSEPISGPNPSREFKKSSMCRKLIKCNRSVKYITLCWDLEHNLSVWRWVCVFVVESTNCMIQNFSVLWVMVLLLWLIRCPKALVNDCWGGRWL